MPVHNPIASAAIGKPSVPVALTAQTPAIQSAVLAAAAVLASRWLRRPSDYAARGRFSTRCSRPVDVPADTVIGSLWQSLGSRFPSRQAREPHLLATKVEAGSRNHRNCILDQLASARRSAFIVVEADELCRAYARTRVAVEFLAKSTLSRPCPAVRNGCFSPGGRR